MIVTEHETTYDRIARAIEYLQNNMHRQPELNEVAEDASFSPFHFQRLFTEWAGISPKRFLQFLTADYLKKRIHTAKTLDELAEEAGLSSQSRVYDLFTTLEAVTPGEYKSFGKNTAIEFGVHDTPFGSCLIGITTRGICWLSFVDTGTPENEIEKMKSHWFASTITQNQEKTMQFIQTIFGRHTNDEPRKIHLLVKGTNFQVKVWEALLKIPMGEVATYQGVAHCIDRPGASQAVGSAVGSNHIAYLIPCHRIIRKDGVLGEYRWSPVRKKSMIGWEMANAETIR